MKKSAIGLLFAAFLSLSALAQSVQEGINHLYAQRFQSARSAFEKMLAANPNNIIFPQPGPFTKRHSCPRRMRH